MVGAAAWMAAYREAGLLTEILVLAVREAVCQPGVLDGLCLAEESRAAFTGVRTVPVHVGVLHATVLLQGLGRTTEDQAPRATADTTATLLRAPAWQQSAEGTP
ncbi:hypothetical protein [Streptomyces yaizuensis]|uniref:Uncharacterized protein n=1 Tax=Streptomyces yaizuensis TaxID=2989713 RepID=A0ABQ5NXS8_9ACTN|nr:hypothetical protein [Streptomyces sp. YSPA8]GLF95164.1 hypothetical protein SYYSPA8_12725 [Streptomyces sp. YSPA8]